MKQHIRNKLFILGLVVLGLLFVHCGDSAKESQREMVEKLVETFNKRLPNTTFETDLEKTIVKPAGNGGYWITFKNSTLTTDLVRLMKSTNLESPAKSEDFSAVDTARFEELVLLYGPKEKFLAICSIKGFTVDHRFPPYEGKQQLPNGEELKVEKVLFSVPNVTCRELDISGLVKDIKNEPGDGKRTGTDKGDAGPRDIIFEDMKGEINYTLNQGNNFSVLVAVEKFAVGLGTDNPYLNAYLTGKNVPPPDFDKILRKGMKSLDLGIDVTKLKFSIKRGGSPWDLGNIDNVSFSSFVIPDERDEAKKFFKWGYELGIKNVRVIFPLKQEIEKLGNVKELRFVFAVEHLSPKAVLGLMKFANTISELRDLTDNAKMQEMMFQNMAFLGEIIQSKPVIKFSLSPFKHYLGELSAEAAIKSFLPLQMEIKVNILKFPGILRELAGIKLFSPALLKTITGRVAKLFVLQQNGDAAMMIEYKSDKPGMFFLNGVPIKIPESMFNSLLKSPMERFGF